MEQVTPIYRWARRAFPETECYGSEYLGPGRESGTEVNGIRHEDVERLSFAPDSLDLVVSNDVLEHVNDPWSAIKEIVRVLRKAGELLLTIPFFSGNRHNVRRAQMVDGTLQHLLPPVYHGNPVSSDGSLVFTEFGWEVVEQLRQAGFARAALATYWSLEYGHLGGLQSYFHAVK
jgi:SAM-dependent methyltransferase